MRRSIGRLYVLISVACSVPAGASPNLPAWGRVLDTHHLTYAGEFTEMEVLGDAGARVVYRPLHCEPAAVDNDLCSYEYTDGFVIKLGKTNAISCGLANYVDQMITGRTLRFYDSKKDFSFWLEEWFSDSIEVNGRKVRVSEKFVSHRSCILF